MNNKLIILRAGLTGATAACLLAAVLFLHNTSQIAKAAANWYVAPTGSDAAACTGPLVPCATINGALAKGGFSPGDTILVMEGTYTNPSGEVALIDKSAILLGGWNSGFTSQVSTSVLDGLDANRVVRVLAGVSASLDHFTIQGGNSDPGAGIQNEGVLTLLYSLVAQNNAGMDGGGVNNLGSLTVEDSQFEDNHSGSVGGAILSTGTLTISRTNFKDNTAGGWGGAIRSLGTLTLSDCRVEGGSAAYGGGINAYDTAQITRCVFERNASGDAGGGLYSGGDVVIRDTTFANNKANGSGAAIKVMGGSLALVNSTLSGNRANLWGGGIFTEAGTAKIYSSTIYQNSGKNAGGVGMIGGSLQTANSMIAGNNAVSSGPDCKGTLQSNGYNLVASLSGCTFTPSSGDITGGVPPLGRLVALPGKPGYHPTASTSPTINHGNPAGCQDQLGVAIPQDQRGQSRVGQCDIGAYEYAIPAAAFYIGTSGGTPQHAVPGTTFRTPLLAFVLDSAGSPVPLVSVTFSAPTSGASGTFPGGVTSVITPTDTLGLAGAPTFTANSITGPYAVSASAAGVAQPALFSLANIGWYVANSGSDLNNCYSPGAPCATIDAVFAKPEFLSGDTLHVASGTYTATAGQVVHAEQSAVLLGGWDATFTTRQGWSTIDGEDARRGVLIESEQKLEISRFIIQHGYIGYGTGGGIDNGGELVLDQSYVSYSNAFSGGGGIANHGKALIQHSTIAKNLDGGGINNWGQLTVNNSTIRGNITAVRNDRGTIHFNSSTIFENEAGIFVTGGQVILANSILAGNGLPQDPKNCSGSPLNSLGFNLVGALQGCTFNSVASDLVNSDPKLDELTGQPPAYLVTPHYPLLPGSPAINAGNPAGCTDQNGAPLNSDQRGFARFGHCDIGAVESQPIEFSVKTTLSSAPTCATLTYTINLLNSGAAPVNSVVVTDTVPASIIYIGSLTATSGTTSYQNREVRWEGDLAAGSQVSISFNGIINPAPGQGHTIRNSAYIDSPGLQFKRSVDTLVQGDGCPFTKTVSQATAAPGDVLDYQIALSHSGSDDLPMMDMTDTLPPEISYLAGSLTATSGTANYASGSVTWTGDLAAGGSVKIKFKATVNQSAGLGLPFDNLAYFMVDGHLLVRSASTLVDGALCNLTKYPANPVFSMGAPGAWDSSAVWNPAVIKSGSNYLMYYSGWNGSGQPSIGLATSPDGINWTRYPGNPILAGAETGSVLFKDGLFKLWYKCGESFCLATSPDGLSWTPYNLNPVFSTNGVTWESGGLFHPNVVFDGSQYRMWYTGSDGFIGRIGTAYSNDGTNWTRPFGWYPVLEPGQVGGWDWLDVYAPAGLKAANKEMLFYSGRTLPAARQAGMAQSWYSYQRGPAVLRTGGPGAFDELAADRMAVVLEGSQFKFWYTGVDSASKNRIGYATATVCTTQQLQLPVVQAQNACSVPAYQDGFSNPLSGWPTSSNSIADMGYSSGEFKIKIKQANYLVAGGSGARSSPVVASVRARRIVGTTGAYGLIVSDISYNTFVVFLVEGNKYSLWEYYGGYLTDYIDWTSSPAILTGTAWNSLKMIITPTSATLFANNQQLASAGLYHSFGPYVGVAALSPDTAGIEARFDDFALYPPACAPGSSQEAKVEILPATSPTFDLFSPVWQPGMILEMPVK